jgi:TM2 domain-containing membrane protein YozV
MRTVTIIRESGFFGGASRVDIYVNGMEYAVLKNGETKAFKIEDGICRIQAQQSGSAALNISAVARKSDVVLIEAEEGDVTFLLKMDKMTATPQLFRTTTPAYEASLTDENNGSPLQSSYSTSGQKSKLVAGLLGLLLGSLGVHRFYLGYKKIGILQIIVTLVTIPLSGIGALWGTVEGILILVGALIKTDSNGIPLK